jgi:hypothetical protein
MYLMCVFVCDRSNSLAINLIRAKSGRDLWTAPAG